MITSLIQKWYKEEKKLGDRLCIFVLGFQISLILIPVSVSGHRTTPIKTPNPKFLSSFLPHGTHHKHKTPTLNPFLASSVMSSRKSLLLPWQKSEFSYIYWKFEGQQSTPSAVFPQWCLRTLWDLAGGGKVSFYGQINKILSQSACMHKITSLCNQGRKTQFTKNLENTQNQTNRNQDIQSKVSCKPITFALLQKEK